MKYRIRTDKMADGKDRITVEFTWLTPSLGHEDRCPWFKVLTHEGNGAPWFVDVQMPGTLYVFSSVAHAQQEIDRHIELTKASTVVSTTVKEYP